MDWILERLKEPSTWTGIAGLFGAIGVAVSPDLLVQIGTIVVAVIGAIEIIRKEKK